MMFSEQAEKCRKQANEFVGRPEAPFLLRVASVFDELAMGEARPQVHADPRAIQRISLSA